MVTILITISIIIYMTIVKIMIQLEYFKHQSDHYFVYNLAIAPSCPVSVPKLLFGAQGSAWW